MAKSISEEEVVLTVGSLFSGIGGLDLGLERAGMKVIWQSEIEPYASAVLAKNFQGVENLGDIKRIDWRNTVRPDVLCGGYPCQPFSVSGKRRGEQDERHLWKWIAEAISVLRPDYAILENVRGHLSLGGTRVIGELTELGYISEWRLVSAASVGASHRRDRLIIVSYTDSGSETFRGSSALVSSESAFWGHHRSGSERDPREISLGSSRESPSDRTSSVFGQLRNIEYRGGQYWKTQPGVDRVAHGIPDRLDRLRTLGNAVVPQVAELIGQLVTEHHKRRKHD